MRRCALSRRQHLPASYTLHWSDGDLEAAGFHRVIEAPETLHHFPDRLDLSAPQLTRPPRGYEATDPDLPFLKLTSFGLNSYFADAEGLAPAFIDQAVARMVAARPWVAFLS
ncbi:MAG: DUF2461 family protein [Janthinobacterium lividum]